MKRKTVATLVTTILMTVSLACGQASQTDANPGEEIVARYGEEAITAAELDEMLGSSLAQLRNQIYEKKLETLRQKVFERLVEKAATAAGVKTGSRRGGAASLRWSFS